MRRALNPFSISISLLSLLLCSFSFAHTQTCRLSGCDPNAGDQFGISVAIDNNIAVVGAYQADTNGPDSGAACIFELWANQCIQTQKLIASEASPGDKFGRSVSIQGDTIVVGAYCDDSNGSVYIFKRDGADSLWSQQQKFTAPDAANNDKFGSAVAIDNNTIVVGAYGKQNTGVYVFVQNNSVWSFQQQLTIPDTNTINNYGYSVAIDDDTIIAGAPSSNTPQISDIGSAWIFTRLGDQWSLQSQLCASDFNFSDHFGFSVAIEANVAVIGAYECDIYNVSDAGAAYIFTKTGSSWFQHQKLFDTYPCPGCDFGKAVTIKNQTIFAASPAKLIDGNNTGAVFEFTKNGYFWSQTSTLTSSDSAAGDNFGFSMAACGSHLLIGSEFNNIDGAASGTAYIFDENFFALLADFDNDSDIDFVDFALFGSCWLQNDTAKDIDPPAGNGIVNLGDLSAFCSLWLAGK